MSKERTAADVVASINSGNRVYVHGSSATPHVLLEALVARADELKNVELIHLHTHGPARYADAEFADNFRVANLFVGANMRKKVDQSRVEYLPSKVVM